MNIAEGAMPPDTVAVEHKENGFIRWIQEPMGSIVAAADGRPPADLALDGAELLLVVGPEGGFTNSERCTMREAGWQHLRLAPHILRSETAATVGSAVLRLEWEARAGASDAARAFSQGKVEPLA